MPGVNTLTPITVDGQSLDTLAWGITAKTKTFSAPRNADQAVPGVDGVVASLNDDYDPSLLTLEMYVRGTNISGVIPGGSNSVNEVRNNLETLMFALTKRWALMDVREEVDGLGTIHQAFCKYVSAIEPEMQVGSSGKLKVVLSIPAVFWQDVSFADWSQTGAVSGTTYEVTTLQGGSAPISDAVTLVTGPITNPVVSDIATGASVRYSGVLTGSQQWRVNHATWSTRVGTGLTLGSSDTTGTDVQATTDSSGTKAPFLVFQPALVTGLRRVQTALSGTGLTGATALAVRARRKYLG